MTEQHPIIPSYDQAQLWAAEAIKGWRTNGLYERNIANFAAQWGADQELKACCEWLQARISEGWNPCHLEDLRNSRRPKSPSVKEQALLAINTAFADGRLSLAVSNVVRRALEALPE